MIKHSLYSLPLFAFIFFFSVCFLIPDIPFVHFDIGWHIEAGNLTRSTGEVPAVEPWSSTAKGYRWLHFYWLWDIAASYLFEKSGDFRFLFIFAALQAGCIGALISLHLRLRNVSPLATFMVVMLFGYTWIIGATLNPSVTISPKTLTFLLFPLTHLLLFLVTERNRTALILLIPLILAVWGNTHSLGVPSITLVGAYGLQLVIRKQWKTALWLGMAAAAGYLMVMLTHPQGWDLFQLIGSSRQDPGSRTNAGTQPFGLDTGPAVWYLAAFLVLGIFSRKQATVADIVLIAFWLFMGLRVEKAFSLFMLSSAPLMGVAVSTVLPALKWLEPVSNAVNSVSKKKAVSGFLLILAVVLVAGSPFYLSRNHPGGMDYPRRLYPQRALNYLQKHFKNKRVLTDWNYGGFIIHKTRGTLPVFIDGRSANAYPHEIIRNYELINTDPEDLIEKYGIEVTFLRRQLPANDYLNKSDRWQHLYTDHLVSIYRRKNMEL